MTPVHVVSMPFNGRCELYDSEGPGEGPYFPCDDDDPDEPRGPGPSAYGQEWAILPIRMPETLTVFTDSAGRAIAAWVMTGEDSKQIRWKDLDTVVRGVEEYNADIASRDH
jgi:hypothetical protein